AAPAQLVEAIEDEPADALAELALLGGQLFQPLPLAAVDPARDQRSENVPGRVRPAVVHRLLDAPDDSLELLGDLRVGVSISGHEVALYREQTRIAAVVDTWRTNHW